MPTPIPACQRQAALPAWRANPLDLMLPHHASRSGASRSPLLALPPLLASMEAASWMCFQGVMGPPAPVIALTA